jgi:hypothetical protein
MLLAKPDWIRHILQINETIFSAVAVHHLAQLGPSCFCGVFPFVRPARGIGLITFALWHYPPP